MPDTYPMLFLLLTITISWGLGNVLVKKGFKSLTPWQTYALDAFFIAFPIWMGYGLLAGGSLGSITIPAILITLFVSIFYALFYYTIDKGEIGLTSSIIATYPIFALILAFIFLNERLETFASLGIFLTIIGVILISLPGKLKFRLENWVLLSLLVSFGYGLSGFFGKLILKEISNATYLMFLAISQIIVVSVWRLFLKGPILPKGKRSYFVFSFLGIVLYNIGNIAYYIALEKGLASIVIPLSNTYITITVIFSLFYLREKISLRQLIGIGTVIVGIILVGFNTNTSTEKIAHAPIKYNREKAFVRKVFDGDTILLIDGRKVRYLGIDTPEVGKDGSPGQCFATEAKHINAQLVENQEIEMEKDQEDKDRYDRLLRYIWTNDVFVNDFLLRQGFARFDVFPTNTRYAEVFSEAVNEAKRDKRGLWKACQP